MPEMDPEILDRCLRRIQSGQATVDECTAENPAQAEMLEPLLQLAAAARVQYAVQGPSQDFLTHSPKRVMNVVNARLKTSASTRRPQLVWLGKPAFRLAGVLIALVLLIGTAAGASASSDALPGDDLYGVKLGLERAALVVSLSPQGDAELLVEYANQRIAEVEELMRRGRGSDIGPALEGYEHAIQKGLEIAAEHGAPLVDLEAALGAHEQVLTNVLAAAPEQAVPGLTRALENSQRGKVIVEQIRSGQRPSELAPGQLKKAPDPDGETELPSGQQNRDKGRDQASGLLKKTQTPNSDGSN
ncbi:MAG: DUF5667 domain-containing protein [Anaerolineales bacterium]